MREGSGGAGQDWKAAASSRRKMWGRRKWHSQERERTEQALTSVRSLSFSLQFLLPALLPKPRGTARPQLPAPLTHVGLPLLCISAAIEVAGAL